MRSTRSNYQELLNNTGLQINGMNPDEEACFAQVDEMFYFTVLTDNNKGTAYNDLTDRFLVSPFLACDIFCCLCLF